MAVVIVEQDKIRDSQATQSSDGLTDTRVFLVKGLTPGPGVRLQAIAACPQYGTPHPAAAIYVTNVVAKPFEKSPTQMFVYVTYSRAGVGYYIVKITGSTGQKTLQVDASGKLLSVSYNAAIGAPASQQNSQTNQLVRNYVDVSIFNPNTVIEFSYQQIACPLAQSASMRGRVNINQFQGQKPYSWMCRRFDAINLQNVLNRWQVTIAFELDTTAAGVLTGWQQIDVFRNKDDNEVPTNIDVTANAPTPTPGTFVEAGGHDSGKGFGVYFPNAVDFSPLGLPDLSTL